MMQNKRVGAGGDILLLGDEGGNHKTDVMAGEPIRLTEQWGRTQQVPRAAGNAVGRDTGALGTRCHQAQKTLYHAWS